MAMLIEPLDGPDGYLRWKESVLLRLHTLGVAHVLSDDPPAPAPALPAGDVAFRATAKKWARDDAVCRGHILAALSDRLLPDYARHVTGRAVWQAVARTYDLGVATPSVSWQRFLDFHFDDDEGASLLEQIAHAEALAAAADHPLVSGSVLVRMVCQKLPADVGFRAMVGSVPGRETMDAVWAVARAKEESRILKDLQRRRQRIKRVRSTGGTAEKHGHMAKNRMS
jgi:hypothetical protein